MTLSAALRDHWPEYAIEAAGLGVFMLSACLFTVLLQPVTNAPLQRALMGLAMGATAAAIIYSPWGQRSGAHLNPAVTLTYLRLGRIPAHDAAFYVLAQVAGGTLGVALAWAIAPRGVEAAHFAATLPQAGRAAAFAAETLISFVLMSAVLAVSASRFARWTGACAAALVAFYIFAESPISGMSMNPARTLASALGARDFTAIWIYFLAPALGMLAAGAAQRQPGCAKLDHPDKVKCIFCEQRLAAANQQDQLPLERNTRYGPL